MMDPVSIGNWFVSAILQSPLHGMMSSSTDLVRYTGRRSGRTITTPTQYVRSGEEVVILAGRPATKRWWRNFTDGADLELLLDRRWVPMRAEALRGADRPEEVAPLLGRYLERFPGAAKALDGDTTADRLARAVVVRCRPRPTES
jgi:hypothetical protein